MNELSQPQKTILRAAVERKDGSIYPLQDHVKGGAAKKVIDSLRAKGLIDDTGRMTALGYSMVDSDRSTSGPTDESPAVMETECSNEAPANYVGETKASESPIPFLVETNDGDAQTIEAQANGDNDLTDTAMFSVATRAGIADVPAAIDGETNETDQDSFEEDVIAAEQALAETKTRRVRDNTKQAKVIELLKRPEGATTAQIAEATGWQNHTIRGFLSIAKKKLGLNISTNRMRVVGPNQQGSPGSFTTYFAV